jgi:hypothetical protein
MCENESRVERLRAALLEIKAIADVSEGRAAEFYGMVASKALELDEQLLK